MYHFNDSSNDVGGMLFFVFCRRISMTTQTLSLLFDGVRRHVADALDCATNINECSGCFDGFRRHFAFCSLVFEGVRRTLTDVRDVSTKFNIMFLIFVICFDSFDEIELIS